MQHPVDRADVEVVLVLGRLLRLRLDQDRALEADLLLVLDHHGEETAELRELALHVGVEQRLVALAPAPEHVVGALQLVRDVEDVLHLRRGVGEDVGVGIGGGARHEAAVGEEVGRAPAGASPSTSRIFFAKTSAIARTLRFDSARLAPSGAMSRSWKVKKGTPRSSNISKATSAFSFAFSIVSPNQGRGKVGPPKRIGAGPGKAVPVADGEAEVILHPLAEHFAVRVVVAEGEGITAFRPFVTDGLQVAEKAGAHDFKASLMAG